MSEDVAVFDVDGTLTVRDCVRPFLVRVGGWHGLAGAVLRRPGTALRAAVRRDRDTFKELMVGGVLRGRDVCQVEQLGVRFADEVAGGWLRADTVERLRCLRVPRPLPAAARAQARCGRCALRRTATRGVRVR
jgi:phosphatidylglycerophosphatase C